MSYYDHFEIDIIQALASQLITAFDQLTLGALTPAHISALPKQQGVYQLYKDGVLIYVGKADNLPHRLRDHHEKISGRQHITVDQMAFKCLSIHPHWTALAPEETLIKYYKAQNSGYCEWNGNSFGPHDPGRERETTNKLPHGFDAQYPIKDDWICDWIQPGTWNGNDLLRELKRNLPYLLRYETTDAKRWQAGHPDYNTAIISVPRTTMPAHELLRTISQQLPGWQATVFPSHMILYKESRLYAHGTVL